ncbi:MAG: hypothetical protein U0931_39525 [Vulcanimicrobiota bacterium]
MLRLLNSRSPFQRGAQRQAVQETLEAALQGQSDALEALRAASQLDTPLRELISNGLALVNLNFEPPAKHQPLPGPSSDGPFRGPELEQAMKGHRPSCPDSLGRFCVDREHGRVWSLGPEPIPLGDLPAGPEDQFVTGPAGFLVAYRAAPFRTTEYQDPTPVTYRIYDGRSQKVLAVIEGDNRAEPAVSPCGDLFVLPGKLVTLYWAARNQSRQYSAGSLATFSPDGSQVALCGTGVDILETATGKTTAAWKTETRMRNSVMQVYLTWSDLLCEFYEYCDQCWEHSFRRMDVGLKIRRSCGAQVAALSGTEDVHWAVAASSGAFRCLHARVELVSPQGQVQRSWLSHTPVAGAPSVKALENKRFLIAADRGGLWVVDDHGRECFSCPPFGSSPICAFDANSDWIVALDYSGWVNLWSARDGRRQARSRCHGSGYEVRLCGDFLHTGSQLWRLP